jgi:hypothetical protein
LLHEELTPKGIFVLILLLIIELGIGGFLLFALTMVDTCKKTQCGWPDISGLTIPVILLIIAILVHFPAIITLIVSALCSNQKLSTPAKKNIRITPLERVDSTPALQLGTMISQGAANPSNPPRPYSARPQSAFPKMTPLDEISPVVQSRKSVQALPSVFAPAMLLPRSESGFLLGPHSLMPEVRVAKKSLLSSSSETLKLPPLKSNDDDKM